MSKFEPLWSFVKKSDEPILKMSFSEIEAVAGTPIDHSFLKYKKELVEYGYSVFKISMKEQFVIFKKN